jgi:hypothetical protein
VSWPHTRAIHNFEINNLAIFEVKEQHRDAAHWDKLGAKESKF